MMPIFQSALLTIAAGVFYDLGMNGASLASGISAIIVTILVFIAISE